MRLPRLRFTVRRMMVGVAILAIPCWIVERGSRFQGLAKDHRSKAGVLGFDFNVSSGARKLLITGEDGKPLSKAQHEWHSTLGDKDGQAASRPWLPVEPDPPEPK